MRKFQSHGLYDGPGSSAIMVEDSPPTPNLKPNFDAELPGLLSVRIPMGGERIQELIGWLCKVIDDSLRLA